MTESPTWSPSRSVLFTGQLSLVSTCLHVSGSEPEVQRGQDEGGPGDAAGLGGGRLDRLQLRDGDEGDPRFAHHKCRAMQGVSVSVSQLNRNDKNLLRKSLETHGGSYSAVLDMEKTSVLVSLSSLSYFSVKSTITTVRSALVLLETSTATPRSGRFPA